MTTLNKLETYAWEFLLRNPKYKAEARSCPTFIEPKKDKISNSFYEQLPSDLAAHNWGLLAFKDPEMPVYAGTPFWSALPTIEAEIAQHGQPALIPMFSKVGASISGLLLLNGNLILKIKHGGRTVQIRIKDGRSFSQNSGLVIRLPVALNLPVQLSRSIDLWNIATGYSPKKSQPKVKLITTSYYSPLMAI